MLKANHDTLKFQKSQYKKCMDRTVNFDFRRAENIFRKVEMLITSVSIFLPMFSKVFFFRVFKTHDCVEKSYSNSALCHLLSLFYMV